MRKAVNLIFALTLLLGLSCVNKVTLPQETHLGDLVKIENKDRVTTNNGTISPKAGEVVYVLSFEGKKEIDLWKVGVSKMSVPAFFPLVDANGKEFAPAFAGSPTQEGTLSDKDLKFDGHLTATAKAGESVYTGRVILPEPKLTLVYVVPKNASLVLKGPGQQHPIN